MGEVDSPIVMLNSRDEPFIIESTSIINKRKYANVKFLNTGKTDTFRFDATINGEIKDRYSKTVFGVACIGMVKKVGNEREYGIWSGMLRRCYVENNKSYSNYGGNGVTVSERWLCFENFLNDIKYVDGYDEDSFKEGLLYLDKDVKQKGENNKVYSLDTCTFLTREENNKHRDVSNIRKIRAIGINDENIVYIDNIPKFAIEYGMCSSGIYECLSGIKKSHNGWRFKKWKK